MDTYLEWLNDFCWIEYGKHKFNGVDTPFLVLETMHASFTFGQALPTSTETLESDEEHGDSKARPRRRALVDSRDKICGYINIDDPISCPRLENDDVVIILLSVAQPSDFNRSEDPEIAYGGKEGSDPSLRYVSRSRGTESTAANETTQPPWDIIQPSPKAGTSTTDHGWGYLAKEDEDTFNFDFYNVMLVHLQDPVLAPDDSGGVTVRSTYERVGLGKLHYKALNWAVHPPWEARILLG